MEVSDDGTVVDLAGRRPDDAATTDPVDAERATSRPRTNGDDDPLDSLLPDDPDPDDCASAEGRTRPRWRPADEASPGR